MLYGAELWPLTVVQNRKAGSRTSQVPETNNGYLMERQSQSNERIRAQTQLAKIDLIIKERRLILIGHVLQMDDNRLLRQAVDCDIG